MAQKQSVKHEIDGSCTITSLNRHTGGKNDSVKTIKAAALGEVNFTCSPFSFFRKNQDFFDVIDSAFDSVSSRNSHLFGLESLSSSRSNLFLEHAYFYLSLIRRNIRRFLTEKRSLFETPLKFGLLYNNIPIGAAIAMRTGRRTWLIETLAIKNEYQNKGLGKILVSEVVNNLKDRLADSIIISVNASNIPAVRLYQSLGFKEQEARLFLKLSCSGSTAEK